MSVPPLSVEQRAALDILATAGRNGGAYGSRAGAALKAMLPIICAP
jgi:hypothetical protein